MKLLRKSENWEEKLELFRVARGERGYLVGIGYNSRPKFKVRVTIRFKTHSFNVVLLAMTEWKLFTLLLIHGVSARDLVRNPIFMHLFYEVSNGLSRVIPSGS